MEYGCVCIKRFDSDGIETRPNVGTIRIIDKNHRISIPIDYLEMLKIKLGDTLKDLLFK